MSLTSTQKHIPQLNDKPYHIGNGIRYIDASKSNTLPFTKAALQAIESSLQNTEHEYYGKTFRWSVSSYDNKTGFVYLNRVRTIVPPKTF